ncbi:MAG TPA: hypothetical protein PKD58_02205 [Candidatus Sumerlaeota bacterium]|nr:hypothetical protein [Candidatus Sumerlaeota bacterium]
MANKPVEYNATVTHIQKITPTLAIFRVQGDTAAPTFIPGQYAILGLNHPERGGVMRAYSIASAPYRHAEYLEFYIRYVQDPTSDNPLTHLLFEAKEGDRILMRPKIQGHFTEEKTMGTADKRLKILVASGTGLAPFTSMVFEKFHQTGNTDGYAIIHGASYDYDLGYRERLDDIMNRGTAKRYIGTVSRPKHLDWHGYVGRVESHFEPGKIEKLEEDLGLGKGGFNPNNCTIMICGLQGTIQNTITNLLHRGFVPGDRKLHRMFGIPEDVKPSLYYEQYDTTPIIDPKNEQLIDECIERLRKNGISAQKPAPEVAATGA